MRFEFKTIKVICLIINLLIYFYNIYISIFFRKLIRNQIGVHKIYNLIFIVFVPM